MAAFRDQTVVCSGARLRRRRAKPIALAAPVPSSSRLVGSGTWLIVMFSESRAPSLLPLASVNRALIDAASVPVNRSPGVFTRLIRNTHESVPPASAPLGSVPTALVHAKPAAEPSLQALALSVPSPGSIQALVRRSASGMGRAWLRRQDDSRLLQLQSRSARLRHRRCGNEREMYACHGRYRRGWGLCQSVSQGATVPGGPVAAIPVGDEIALFLADPAGGVYTCLGRYHGEWKPWRLRGKH